VACGRVADGALCRWPLARLAARRCGSAAATDGSVRTDASVRY